jgi:hypothetical protein
MSQHMKDWGSTYVTLVGLAMILMGAIMRMTGY